MTRRNDSTMAQRVMALTARVHELELQLGATIQYVNELNGLLLTALSAPQPAPDAPSPARIVTDV
jgi:hypothetical protein